MRNSRRSFLFGAAGTAALLAGSGARAAAQTPYACTPPNPTGVAPTPWRRPESALVQRSAAWSLTSTDANTTKLRHAYAIMQSLPASNPHSMAAQRNMHAWYCNDCGSIDTHEEIHGSYKFLAWHRAFLYFHERILGKLIDDATLRLTYYDWEHPLHRALPPIYAAASQPLWHKRVLTPPSPIAPAEIFNGVPGMMNYAVDDFFGTVTAGGSVEARPHNKGHVSIGDDMGVLNTAAFDPIFYSHHGNVDRMWASWQRLHPGQQPSGTAYSAIRFAFWDENKRWVSIGVNDVSDTRSLGYEYSAFITPPSRALRSTIPLTLTSPSRLGSAPAANAFSGADTVDVRLENLQIPGDEGNYTVQAVTPDGKVHDIGIFSSIPHVRAGAMNMARDLRSVNLVLPVAPALAATISVAGTTFRVRRTSARGIGLLQAAPPQITPAHIGAISLVVR